VIVLSFYEERTAADVASMLGTTAGNVRVIRHRGLARLRSCVDGGLQ
jgi:RNA polymerase sigma-70 factor (ECF subfamily)